MSRWLAHMPGKSGTILVCFPFAGGGASAFATWRRALAPDLSVCAVQLPGREGRSAETRLRDYETLYEALAEALLPVLMHRTVVFYGHSLGAWIAWDMARALASAGTPPRGLVVSAQRAPSCRYPFKREASLGDEELAAFLTRFDGIGDSLVNYATFRQWMLPLTRDDLSLCETFPMTTAKESFPIHALGGRLDRIVQETEVCAWRHHTSAGFRYSAIDGGHFFIRSHQAAVLDHLKHSIEEWTIHEYAG